jgi:homocysteine S-methyltransferase
VGHSPLEERRAGSVLVGDGGMGSLLKLRVPEVRLPEQANLIAPEAVLALHIEFIRAGADVIQTNTYGANQVKFGLQNIDHDVAAANAAGAKIAREAREVAGRDVLIAGSIGPLGTSVELIGGATSGGAQLYADQAGVLEGRGVDLIVLETFTSLDELMTAVAAVRAACSLPVVAQVTVQEDGRTMTGAAPEQLGEALAGSGVTAVGINCSLGPQSALAGLTRLRQTTALPTTVQPNIGLPFYQDGRVLYPDGSDAYIAEFAAEARELGASLIGGCCGCQPHHIAAIRAAVDARRPPRYSLGARETAAARPPAGARASSRLATRLREGTWVTSVEVDPPKGANLERLLDVVARLAARGIDIIDVNDNPMARARMSSLAASALIERHADVETIPHLTPRDATPSGLESQLLGAYAAGIRNILAVTGDHPPPGDGGLADPPQRMDSIGLVELIGCLNEGRDRAGRVLDAPTDFAVGVALNPTADDLPLELDRLRRKVDAGATFAMTQVLFDLGPLERLLEQLGGSWPIPVLVGVWPLTSLALGLRLQNEVPGITVPDAILGRLADAGAGAPEVGVAVARDVLAGARSLASGVYLVAPFGQPERVLDVLA